MAMRHGFALRLQGVNGRGAGAVGAAPAEHQQIAARRAIQLLRRDVLGNVRHLCGARVHHVLVIGRVVADIARDVLLLQAADAVL